MNSVLFQTTFHLICVRLASGMLVVRIPAARDLSCKKKVSDSSTANRCECHGSSEIAVINGCSVSQCHIRCHSRCGTLKNPHCSVAMSAEHRSKFAALQWQWWRLHMSEKFSCGTIKQNITVCNTLLFVRYDF